MIGEILYKTPYSGLWSVEYLESGSIGKLWVGIHPPKTNSALGLDEPRPSWRLATDPAILRSFWVYLQYTISVFKLLARLVKRLVLRCSTIFGSFLDTDTQLPAPTPQYLSAAVFSYIQLHWQVCQGCTCCLYVNSLSWIALLSNLSSFRPQVQLDWNVLDLSVISQTQFNDYKIPLFFKFAGFRLEISSDHLITKSLDCGSPGMLARKQWSRSYDRNPSHFALLEVVEDYPKMTGTQTGSSHVFMTTFTYKLIYPLSGNKFVSLARLARIVLPEYWLASLAALTTLARVARIIFGGCC